MAHTLVEQEITRRVASESGPDFSAGGPRVAMVYPSPYRVGMSSLGFQWIATLLREAGFAVERAFLPDEPAAWRRQRLPVLTYETLTPLSRFPILAVSFAYELEVAGLIEMLDMCGIPPLREDRGPQDPMILVGGPITMASPMVLAPFADAVILGEGEETAVPAVSALFDAETREGWLDALAALPGAWIPERHGNRLPAMARASDALLPARSAWIAPDAELSSMFLLEAERGCHRQCTFCVMRRSTQGGMRLVQPDRVLSLVPDEARKVGLVGAAVSDHPNLVELLDTLVAEGRQVAVSSLRADRIRQKPRISELLRQSGARTLTVASDGASERLRRTLIKGARERDLLACAQRAGELGFDVYKVYMMLGLPGETDEDMEELIRFTLELAHAARPARVALGVSAFVAKRNTPLDGSPFAGIKTVDRRVKQLLRGLKGRAEVRPVSTRWAWVEYELSQGGPEVAYAALQAWRDGGRFADWRRALEAIGTAHRRPWAATG